MQEIYKTISDWPAILQGVIGAGLFSLLLYAGQKTASFLTEQWAKTTRNRKESQLRNQLVRLHTLSAANSGDLQKGAYFASGMLVRSSRYLLKGLLWITFGLLFQSVLSVFGTIGFLGAAYYFFNALNIVRAIEPEANLEEKISKLDTELKQLTNK